MERVREWKMSCLKLMKSLVVKGRTETKTEKERKLDLLPLDALFEHFHQEEVLDDLLLLKAFVMDPPKELVEDGTFKVIESMASKAGSIISSFDLKNMDKAMTIEFQRRLGFITMSMSHWRFEARRFYQKRPKPSRDHYPRTGQLGFVNHLVENLEALLVKANKADDDDDGDDDSIGLLKYYILRFQRRLRFLNSCFAEIPEARKEEADLKDVMTSITNLAYEAEYVIDSFLVKDLPALCCMWWLRDILKEFESGKRELNMESGKRELTMESGKRELNMEFGGVGSTINSILDSAQDELQIIPLVSKTEITKKLRQVFNHPDIVRNFDIRTWGSVSSYKERKKEVLLDLLHNVSYHPCVEQYTHKMGYTIDKSEYEMKRTLFKILEDSPYFVILEDVRDIDALDDIIRVLPDNCYQSRILLTTPSLELALQCRYGSQEVVLNKKSKDHSSTSQPHKPTIDDDVVGFKGESERMLERLIRGPAKLHIISIFGMPGQGKTTLAKKLYSDVSVIDYFHTRAWCCVSQVYEKRKLLLELLGQVVQLSNAVHQSNDEELAAMLCRSLRGQRFLVVLDDMWSTVAWDNIRRCFPSDNNGSRIVFTTRLQGLASQAQSGSILQPLGLLSDDESWVLLEKKLFQKENCPPELLGVGREIAKNCKGLPLSVVLIAGLLAKMEKKKDWLKQIAESLSSHILGDGEAQGKAVIELSYKHLPNHLKPCFLYFGAFLEDGEVLVSKLISLWISEGFVKDNDFKSLEDVAEDYLTDLIRRSLVTIAQKKSKGGVKTCRVHDLIREFCSTKAREENFLEQIREYDDHFPSSNDSLDCGLDPNYSYSSTPITYHLRRLCIYSKMNHFITLKPFGPLVRSLLFFASNDICPSISYDISFIYHNFKLLRILNLEGINIGDSFMAIDVLVQLRYLAVQSSVDFVPSSIANLWNLETLYVKSIEDKVVKVPDSIWDMSKLRHMHINDNASFDLDHHRLENSSLLDNLQNFSTPSLAYGDDMEKIMRRLRGIRKLKCIFLDSRDDATNSNRFPELGFLSQLVSLKVLYNGDGIYPCQFNFPSTLKKLTLSNFQMPWNEISQLAALCNLEVLKLLCNAFEGERWVMEDEVFPKLKFLKLDTLNVVKWSATCDHFPHLERLLLHKCEQLEKIPPGIGDIPTLLMIEVMWCNPSAAISAKNIQEEQLDFGNEELKIHIHPKVWDLESS